MSGSRPKPPQPPSTALAKPGIRGARMASVKGSLPTVRIIPPVSELLSDIYSVAKTELARIKAKQAETDGPSPGVAHDLDKLAGAVVKASRRDAEVQREMAEELAGYTDEELAALAAGEEGREP